MWAANASDSTYACSSELVLDRSRKVLFLVKLCRLWKYMIQSEETGIGPYVRWWFTSKDPIWHMNWACWAQSLRKHICQEIHRLELWKLFWKLGLTKKEGLCLPESGFPTSSHSLAKWARPCFWGLNASWPLGNCKGGFQWLNHQAFHGASQKPREVKTGII